MTSRRPSAVPWPPLLLGATIAIGVGLDHLAPVSLFGGPVGRTLGGILSIAALSIDIAAVLTLVLSKTTVLPHRGSDVLVTGGIFALSRNPIYVGNVLLTIGLAFLLANAWLLAGAALEALLVRRLAILPEERHLEARFGTAWQNYRDKVPRWFGVRTND